MSTMQHSTTMPGRATPITATSTPTLRRAGLVRPPRLHPIAPDLVPPEEIMLDSAREIRRGLWKRSWKAGLLAALMWWVLSLNYVIGTAPTTMLLLPLITVADPGTASSYLHILGFWENGMAIALLAVPLLAGLLTALLVPLAAPLIASMNPQTYETERAFRQALSARVTAVVMALPLAAIALQLLFLLTPVSTPWSDLLAGPLAALGIGAGVLAVFTPLFRSLFAAEKILPLARMEELERLTFMPPPGPNAVPLSTAALGRLGVRDTRFMPPPRDLLTYTRPVMTRSLTTISRHCAISVPLLLGLLTWIVFGMQDLISFSQTVVSGTGSALQAPRDNGLDFLGWLSVLGFALVALAAMALVPTFAARAVTTTHERMYGPEPYETNNGAALCEEFLMTLSRRSQSMIAFIMMAYLSFVVFLHVIRRVASDGNASMLGACLALGAAITIVPALTHATGAAIRVRPADIFWGPSGLYQRRYTPWRQIAPVRGTRADREQNPAMLMVRRQRMQHEVLVPLLPGDPPRFASLALEQQTAESNSGVRARTHHTATLASHGLPQLGSTPSAAMPAPGPRSLDPRDIPQDESELRW